MPYFAAALARSGGEWLAREVDLDEVETIDDIVDALHEVDENAEATLLFVEEDDEYVAIVRVDAAGGDEPRVFVSDGRAANTYPLAELLSDETGPAATVLSGEEDAGESSAALGRDSEPLGDAALLADFGTSTAELLELCAHEGTLPSDMISAVCEKANCLDELEALREGVV